MADQQIQLQSDTIAPIPGGGIRMATATVMIGGMPTQVQMQVVTLADGTGVLVGIPDNTAWQRAVLSELHEMRKLMAMFMGIPILDTDDIPAISSPNPY